MRNGFEVLFSLPDRHISGGLLGCWNTHTHLALMRSIPAWISKEAECEPGLLPPPGSDEAMLPFPAGVASEKARQKESLIKIHCLVTYYPKCPEFN